MAKTPSEELVQDIAENFHTYLKKGVRLDSVFGDAHPDLDIDDIESLLRIHFVLTESNSKAGRVGVLDFMRTLEERIRRMKTTTTDEVQHHRGEVRGRIDWQETVKARSRAGRIDEPLFVCRRSEEDYDVDENLVLKRLLEVIYEIVFNDLEHAIENPEDYRWLEDWVSTQSSEGFQPERTAARTLRNIYTENVYLQRVGADETQITNRMIRSVKRSRRPLYRDAAELLDQYRLLTSKQLDAEEAREILDHTLIAPEKTEVLFELYWIFKILESYENVRYEVLSKDNRSTVAQWRTEDAEYVMYHDSTGDTVTFDEDSDDKAVETDGYLYRMDAVVNRWQELSEKLLHRGGSDTLWGGRPDILLERYKIRADTDTRRLDQLFIGEVKYTRNPDYAATGLRELLEYMAFVKDADREYVESKEDLLESVSVKGLLFVDKLDSVGHSENGVDIIQYDDDIEPLV